MKIKPQGKASLGFLKNLKKEALDGVWVADRRAILVVDFDLTGYANYLDKFSVEGGMVKTVSLGFGIWISWIDLPVSVPRPEQLGPVLRLRL